MLLRLTSHQCSALDNYWQRCLSNNYRCRVNAENGSCIGGASDKRFGIESKSRKDRWHTVLLRQSFALLYRKCRKYAHVNLSPCFSLMGGTVHIVLHQNYGFKHILLSK